MTDHLTSRLDENDRLAELLPSGPWRASLFCGIDYEDGSSSYRGGVYPGEESGPAPIFVTNCIDKRDAAFIAHSRSELPALNRAVRAVLERVEKLEAQALVKPADNEYADGVSMAASEVRRAIYDAMGEV